MQRLASELKITTVLNVQSDDDLFYNEVKWSEVCREFVRCGIQLKRVKITDFDSTDLQDKLPSCVSILSASLAAGENVYVHCTAGLNRAPTVIVAYLLATEGLTLDDALSTVTKLRSCKPDLRAIRKAFKDHLQ